MENKLKQALEAKLKGIWDDLADNFLHLDFVREADKAFTFDMVDKMSSCNQNIQGGLNGYDRQPGVQNAKQEFCWQ